MLSPSVAMVVVAAAVAVMTLSPRVIRAPLWRATVTPLASIIGSGFLVSGPVLAHAAGNWAWLGMAWLCATGYLFGAAIRHNIRYVEPMLVDTPPPLVRLLERGSDFALVLAYFVSVTYYLNLFASFALRADDIIDPNLTRWVSSAVIAGLAIIGSIRGLGALENVEASAVGLKLALIAGLLVALLLAAVLALSHNELGLAALHPIGGGHELGMLLGLVILVQGFETSRYLGEAYDWRTRIRTMRLAQLLATAIYLGFILLITPYFTGRLPAAGGETAIIDMLTPLGTVVAPLLILTALSSQLSAAVADMAGAGGLLADATRGRVASRIGYLLTASVALAITWSANIFEIIVYASKAFVLYYALQSALATFIAIRPGSGRSPVRALAFAGGVLLAVLVLSFGIPADH